MSTPTRHTVITLDADGGTSSRLGRWLASKGEALRIAGAWARNGAARVVLVSHGPGGTTRTPFVCP